MSSTPEQIVTSLYWSRQLQKAGWPEYESTFCWCCIAGENFKLKMSSAPRPSFAAPTAEEILRRVAELKGWDLLVSFERLLAWIRLQQMPVFGSLANASAAWYCYLAENGLLQKE